MHKDITNTASQTKLYVFKSTQENTLPKQKI